MGTKFGVPNYWGEILRIGDFRGTGKIPMIWNWMSS